ncbi:MAG: glycosyltransferase family 39 protein [Vicinamibacterales bacterium]
MTPNRIAAVAAVLSLGAGGAAWAWRTAAVGGSDSACYALMAAVFADGALQPLSVLAHDAPWPEAGRVAAPAGFLPSAIRTDAAVPVCAPGYPWLIAPLVAVAGPVAVHLVPAAATALLIWLAFLLGRRLASAWAGLAAAVLVATTPIVQFQAVQPMNDVTTGALWMAVALAVSAARPVAAGLLTGAALLVRPNLAIAAAAALVATAWLRASPPSPGWRRRGSTALVVGGAAAAPGVVVALLLNERLYGSPLRSGYGDLGELFALAHVGDNVWRYGRSWIAGGTPIVLLAALAWRLAPRPRRREAAMVTALAVALPLVYLAYRPFDEWWYLRFLLPPVALAAVLTAVSLDGLAVRWPRVGRGLAGVVVAAVAVRAATTPQAAEARRLRALEARFPLTAATVASRLDAGAVPITVWQSGGLRFWPGREVIVWDALEPEWLDPAIEWLRVHGRQPAIVVERWEEAGFRTRFAGQAYGALDWPPRYDVDRRVRIFLPEDRERYLRGDGVATETIFAVRRR